VTARDNLDVQQLADLIVAGLRATGSRSRRDRTRLMADVAVFVAAKPTASANVVARSVRGRRQDVLACLRELEAARTRFLSSRNHDGGSVG
jgi:hypothetical protein